MSRHCFSSDDPRSPFAIGAPDRLSSEQLVTLAERWQKRLRLTHWDIEVGYARACELDREHRQAEVIYETHSRSARVRLVDPATADGSDWPWNSAEEILVHELLHLVLEPLGLKGDSQRRQEEGVIRVLAAALVNHYGQEERE